MYVCAFLVYWHQTRRTCWRGPASVRLQVSMCSIRYLCRYIWNDFYASIMVVILLHTTVCVCIPSGYAMYVWHTYKVYPVFERECSLTSMVRWHFGCLPLFVRHNIWCSCASRIFILILQAALALQPQQVKAFFKCVHVYVVDREDGGDG